MEIDFKTFLTSPDVSPLVRKAGVNVCAFPFNGTRRWLQLEHPKLTSPDDYERLITQKMAEIFGMIFTHGIDTLIAPMVGPDLMERGDKYLKLAAQMLIALARNRTLLEFYDAFDIRVHFYGDYRRYLENSVCAGAMDDFEEITRRTSSNRSRALCWGIFGQDAVDFTTGYAIRFQQETGRPPEKRDLIAAYYGEPLEAVDLYIGFGAPAVFDVPLLDFSHTNLYFTVSPSPYLNEPTLRRILYDHLCTRNDDPSYRELTRTDWEKLRKFYRQNLGAVLGMGARTLRGGVWIPQNGLKMSSHFTAILLPDEK